MFMNNILQKDIFFILSGIIVGILSSIYPVYSLLLTIGILILIISANKPYLGFLFLVAYVPFHAAFRSISPRLFGPFSVIGSIRDLLLVSLLLFIFLEYAIIKKEKIKVNHIQLRVIVFYLWVFFVVVYSVLLLNRDLLLSLMNIRPDVEYMLLLFVVPYLVNTREKFFRTYNLILISAFIIIIIGLLSYLLSLNVGVVQTGFGERVISTFGTQQTNVYAVYLSMIILLSLGLAGEKIRMFNFLLILLTILSLLLTQSRRGLLSLFIGLGSIVYLTKYKIWVNRFVLVGLIFGIGIPILMWDRILWTIYGLPTKETFMAIIQGAGYSVRGSIGGFRIEPRIEETLTTLRLILENPIMGLGTGKVGWLMLKLKVPGGFALHNYYFALWLRLGLIGLILYLAIIISVIRYGSKLVKKSDENKMKMAISGILAAFIVSQFALFFGGSISAQNGFISWALVGLLLSAGKLNTDKNE